MSQMQVFRGGRPSGPLVIFIMSDVITVITIGVEEKLRDISS